MPDDLATLIRTHVVSEFVTECVRAGIDPGRLTDAELERRLRRTVLRLANQSYDRIVKPRPTGDDPVEV